MLNPSHTRLRYLLGLLLALVAVNAFGGGVYGMLGAEQVPLSWLKSTPFHSYLVPSLILFFVVGGIAAYASIAVFRNDRRAALACYLAGSILACWIMVQVAMIGYVSWLQPVMFAMAILILFLATRYNN